MAARILSEHYLHGLTAGSVSRREGVNEGAFFNIAHRAALLLEPVFKRVLIELRSCLVIHADETGWRNDGSKAFAWIFANNDFEVFLFRDARSSAVPLKALGKAPLNASLVTDRYSGYNLEKALNILTITPDADIAHLLGLPPLAAIPAA